MKTYHLEFKYDKDGLGRLRLYNDGLIVFEIGASTGRCVNGEVRNAIAPAKYEVIDVTKNVIKLEGNKKIATSKDVSNRVRQAIKKCCTIYCFVNISSSEEFEDNVKFSLWKEIKLFWKWLKKSLRWKG